MKGNADVIIARSKTLVLIVWSECIPFLSNKTTPRYIKTKTSLPSPSHTSPLHVYRVSCLFSLFSLQLSVSVGDGDVQLSSTFDDGSALAGRHVVGDLSAVLAVVHEKQVKVVDVRDDELVETVRKNVAGLLVGTVTDVGHGNGAAELTADTAIDTLGSAPGFLCLGVDHGEEEVRAARDHRWKGTTVSLRQRKNGRTIRTDTRMKLSLWKRLNFFVLFLMSLRVTRGAAATIYE